MITLLNNSGEVLQDWSELPFERLSLTGDGFFETMRFTGNAVPLFDFHLSRIGQSCRLLDLGVPDHLAGLLETLPAHLPAIKQGNTGRVRIRFFQKNGSGYFPPNPGNGFETLSMIDQVPDKFAIPIEAAGIYETDLHQHRFSGFKTGGSNLYTVVARKCQQDGFEECVLLNREKWVAEGLHSNLLVFKDGRAYTPRRETGCINGVSLAFLKQLLTKEGIALHDNFFGVDLLDEADEIWFTNALHIVRPLNQWKNKSIQSPVLHRILPVLRQQLGFS